MEAGVVEAAALEAAAVEAAAVEAAALEAAAVEAAVEASFKGTWDVGCGQDCGQGGQVGEGAEDVGDGGRDEVTSLGSKCGSGSLSGKEVTLADASLDT